MGEAVVAVWAHGGAGTVVAVVHWAQSSGQRLVPLGLLPLPVLLLLLLLPLPWHTGRAGVWAAPSVPWEVDAAASGAAVAVASAVAHWVRRGVSSASIP